LKLSEEQKTLLVIVRDLDVHGMPPACLERVAEQSVKIVGREINDSPDDAEVGQGDVYRSGLLLTVMSLSRIHAPESGKKYAREGWVTAHRESAISLPRQQLQERSIRASTRGGVQYKRTERIMLAITRGARSPDRSDYASCCPVVDHRFECGPPVVATVAACPVEHRFDLKNSGRSCTIVLSDGAFSGTVVMCEFY
jgi:hypothetical protein